VDKKELAQSFLQRKRDSVRQFLKSD
jgi:hypothetical protein